MPVKYSPSKAILELGDAFYDVVKPAEFPKAILRYRNLSAAESVGLEGLSDDQWREHFHAFKPLEGGLPECLALRYHGHQFQSYNDQLGDGRGFLFAQLRDDRGRLLDLGTKGSGKTPWSRGGDGRLTLKGAIREALATEMLESLGVKTSKTFAFFETGEDLERGDEPSPTRSAVLTRLGHSHIRFGSFQRLVALGERDAMQTLVDYCRRHFYPNAHDAAELLQGIVVNTARLCASWMAAGFVHGVLNTDNMNVNGESFDYGPYRFLPKYDPDFTAAYFDENGLYAFGRQPEAVIWNLEQLATSFLYVHEDRDALIEAMRMFVPTFNDAAGEFIRARLGLVERSPHVVVDTATEDDLLLAVFNFLGASQMTFEQFFFDWYGGNDSRERAMRSPEAEKYKGTEFDKFMIVLSEWPSTPEAKVRLQDKYFTRKRPCMMLIDEIEDIWQAIAQSDDWSKFEAKIEDVRAMGRLHGRR